MNFTVATSAERANLLIHPVAELRVLRYYNTFLLPTPKKRNNYNFF